MASGRREERRDIRIRGRELETKSDQFRERDWLKFVAIARFSTRGKGGGIFHSEVGSNKVWRPVLLADLTIGHIYTNSVVSFFSLILSAHFF